MRIDIETSELDPFEFDGVVQNNKDITLNFSKIVFREEYHFDASIIINPERVELFLYPKGSRLKEVLKKHCHIIAEFGTEDKPQPAILTEIVGRALGRIAKDASGVYNKVMCNCDSDDMGPRGNLQLGSYLAMTLIADFILNAFKKGLLNIQGMEHQ
jgi:hypothetical protein